MGGGHQPLAKKHGKFEELATAFSAFFGGEAARATCGRGEATAWKLRRGAAPFSLPSGASQPRGGIVKSPLERGAGYKTALAQLGVGSEDAAAAGGAGPAPAAAPEQLGAGGR